LGKGCGNRANFGVSDFGCFDYGGSRSEFLKETYGAIAAATGGVDTALDEGEGLGVLADGFTGAVALFHGAEELGDLVVPEGGFDGGKAAEFPVAHDEVIEDSALFGGGGAVPTIVVIDQLLEVCEVLAGDDEGFSIESGFKSVHGTGGLAFGSDGTG